MRKIARPPLEIFTLSFLDIISCAFAAIVMLVLMSKKGDEDVAVISTPIQNLIKEVAQAKASLDSLITQVNETQQEVNHAELTLAERKAQANQMSGAVPRAEATLQQLRDQAASLQQELQIANARLNNESKPALPDQAVGGIPTDADYVIFVIDNSGSMSSGGKWKQVVSVVSDILKNHPQMKGFQILAADGEHLYSGREGRWLTDTPTFRQKVISRLTSFTGGASAPEVGIKRALTLYKKESGKVSLYVFGDDYRPGTLDDVVTDITRLNRDSQGKPKMRIHGVGFYRPHDGNAAQFAAFMQAVAKRNRGAFIGLDF
ncbi:VWA domain-containing protein [Pseudoalteromonas xiamenensis]